MRKVHRMAESLEVGKIGEETVANYFKNKNYVRRVHDMRGNGQFRKMDVDFALELSDGSIHWLEVKTDQYSHTGNIFVEDVSCIEMGTIGCIMKTKARFLGYFFVDTHELYLIHVERFREWYEKHKSSFRRCEITNARVVEGQVYHSIGHLVPRKLLEHQPFVRKHQIERKKCV